MDGVVLCKDKTASLQHRVSAVIVLLRPVTARKALTTSQSSRAMNVLRKHSSDEAEATRCRPSGEAKATPEVRINPHIRVGGKYTFRGKWRVNA